MLVVLWMLAILTFRIAAEDQATGPTALLVVTATLLRRDEEQPSNASPPLPDDSWHGDFGDFHPDRKGCP
jgi:hypothetical protein